MPHSPYFLYETLNREPGMPEEPVLIIGAHVQADGSLACLILTPQYGPFPFAFPPGMLTPTPYGFTWAVGNAPPAIYQLMMQPRFDEYWRPRLPGPIPSFATNEDLWRWFSERYGWGWPEQAAAPAPPAEPTPSAATEIDRAGPPGAPVTPQTTPAPPLAPPGARWIELSLGEVPAEITGGERHPMFPTDDFPSGLAVRWGGERGRLFQEAIVALGRGIDQWEAHELVSLLPMTLEQAGSAGSPLGWLSAQLGTRDNPDATAQFAVVPVEGFPHGLVLAWPANQEGGPLFRRLAEEMRRADTELTHAEPSAPAMPQPPTAASPLPGMVDEWTAFVQSNRTAETMRLLAVLQHAEESGTPDTAALHALGDAAGHERYAAADTTVIDWLYADPSSARLAVVEPFFAAFTAARADPAITERVNVTFAAVRRSLPQTPPLPVPAPAAPMSASPVGAPPSSSHDASIEVRQLPPSEDPELPPPLVVAPPGAPAAVPSAAMPPGTVAPAPTDSAAPPTLLLIVEDGGVEGQRVPLTERVTVGRHASSNLVLPDLEVSRGHAVIERDAQGQVTITDLGSANGTYVNGQRVTRHILRPGDRLTLGQTHLRVIENA